jgi:enamine deaminase RidA (YjgF/YER057c/UK114 family)
MTSSEKVAVFAGAKPIGPYSPAIRQGKMLFASGQIGTNPETGKLVEGGVEAEARQMLENMKNLISSGGSSLENVVKTTSAPCSLLVPPFRSARFQEVRWWK